MPYPLPAYVVPVVLIAARAGGLLSFLPVFGTNAVSWRVKAGLTMALTAVLAPGHLTPLPGVGPITALGMVVSELALGLATGLLLYFVFEGMELAGQVIGFQLGFSLANLIDPTSPVNTPVMSVFHRLVAILIFLQLDVHHWVLRALASSFTLVPLGGFTANWIVTHGVLTLGNMMWVVGVQIAAPVLVATFLTDWAMGFLSKASPQFPVLFVGMSIKSLLGFALLAATVVYWPRYLEGYFGRAISAAVGMMGSAH